MNVYRINEILTYEAYLEKWFREHQEQIRLQQLAVVEKLTKQLVDN